MAKEWGLRPVLWTGNKWGPAEISGEELEDFDLVDNPIDALKNVQAALISLQRAVQERLSILEGARKD